MHLWETTLCLFTIYFLKITPDIKIIAQVIDFNVKYNGKTRAAQRVSLRSVLLPKYVDKSG